MTVMVIDVGSSSVRTLLVDEQLQVVGESVSRCEHSFYTDAHGASTADAVELRKRVETTISGTLKHPRAQHIVAVGMDTFVGNLLGVDAHNNPVTPLYTYADTRSAHDVEQLADLIDTDAVHQRTGCPNHTSYSSGRLAWLKRTEPELFERVVQWIDFGTYCYREWFNREVPGSYSVASWSGLFNRESMTWDDDLLQILGVSPEKFSALTDVYDAQQRLSPKYAEMWVALADVSFYLAVGDGAAANIGSGGVHADHMVLTVGTTAALRIVRAGGVPAVPSGLWSYRVDATHHLIGGATSEGGNIFEWAQATLNLSGADVEVALASRQPDAHGLTFLPLLAGERSPGYATRATGTLHGLRLSTTPLDILQAGLEGVALRLSLIADLLAERDVPVYAGGGAMFASAAWAQMIASALNRPLHLLDEPEVTARGVAAIITGQFEQASSPKIARTIVPNPDHAEIFAAARQRQISLYKKLVG